MASNEGKLEMNFDELELAGDAMVILANWKGEVGHERADKIAEGKGLLVEVERTVTVKIKE